MMLRNMLAAATLITATLGGAYVAGTQSSPLDTLEMVSTDSNMRHCRYDDGSGPLPCVWDARHMGNGQGKSFIARRSKGDDPRIFIIRHRRAHRLAN